MEIGDDSIEAAYVGEGDGDVGGVDDLGGDLLFVGREEEGLASGACAPPLGGRPVVVLAVGFGF